MEMTHHNHVKRALLIFGALVVAAVVALKVLASRNAAGTPASSAGTSAPSGITPANGETLVTEVFTSNPATSNGSPTGTTSGGTSGGQHPGPGPHNPVDPLPGSGRLPGPVSGPFQPRGTVAPPRPMRPAAFANPGRSARTAIELRSAGSTARGAVRPATPAPRPNPRMLRPAGAVQPVAAGVSAGKQRSLARLGAA